VILHTNLGRAPLATAAVRAVTRAASGYSDLEVDRETGRVTPAGTLGTDGYNLSLSKDGRWLVANADTEGGADIWMLDYRNAATEPVAVTGK